MSITASLNLFDEVIIPDATYSTELNSDGQHVAEGYQDNPNSANTLWAIRPKWECPVIDISGSSYDSGYNHDVENGPYFSKRTGRSIWHSYADVREVGKTHGHIFNDEGEHIGRKGIKYYLRESYSEFDSATTGSLIELCGFDSADNENFGNSPEDTFIEKRIGDLADQTEIAECIVAIPYVEEAIENLTIKPFQNIENAGHINAIPINPDEYYRQFRNVIKDRNPVTEDLSITETTISRLIKNMKKYVFPPNIDFYSQGIMPSKTNNYQETKQVDAYGNIQNENSKGLVPFVMYTFEVSSMLDTKDLADIWQNVMPKQAMTAEEDMSIIDHDLLGKDAQYEFFGQLDLIEEIGHANPAVLNKKPNLPTGQAFADMTRRMHGISFNKESLRKIFTQEIKWLVFKVKKRANNSYEKLMRLNAFVNGNGVPSIQDKLSYNWPHDFYSLSELNKITAEVSIGPDKEE